MAVCILLYGIIVTSLKLMWKTHAENDVCTFTGLELTGACYISQDHYLFLCSHANDFLLSFWDY